MELVRTIAAVRSCVAAWRSEGLTVGFVPTMGALHEGHLSLVDRSRRLCNRTVTSIFVNPLQFGPSEDFEAYPRSEEADRAKLSERQCDILFAPSAAEMFPDKESPPEDFLTAVSVRKLTEGLCGAYRSTHFQGMATEVVKTFMIVNAHVAFFGEKDYQQLQVVRRMVRDLNIDMIIEAVQTVREADGLAMSSRNAYLSPDERLIAPGLYKVLRDAAAGLSKASCAAGPVLEAARAQLLSAGFTAVDYVSMVDPEHLRPLERRTQPARLLAAAWLGRTRLIDNVPVP